jgi:hypothetical protein
MFFVVRMLSRSKVLSIVVLAGAVASLSAEQTFTGRLSDNACGVSHASRAQSAELSDRQCLTECINRLAKYVLVDQENRVIPIANQDARGLPLYAGRPVKITGELRGNAVFVTKVEAIPAHLHIGHVMTNWRDTPGTRGFLPVAIEEARIAVLHAGLAAKSTTLDDIKLHAGHVLNALDPSIEPKGPGTGYGLEKAASGAVQHLELAAKAEGATGDVTKYAAQVSASLNRVTQWAAEAVAIAGKIRAAADLDAAAVPTKELMSLTQRISDEGLKQALENMNLMLKAEGLLGAPR